MKAKQFMARLPWKTLDVLVIDQTSKNISGAGMDSNITGRMRFSDGALPSFAATCSRYTTL